MKCTYCGNLNAEYQKPCPGCGWTHILISIPEPEARHCSKCGTVCALSWEYKNEFHPSDGTQLRKYTLKCPNKKHIFDGHFKATANSYATEDNLTLDVFDNYMGY